jgi:hypothetical protein
MASRRLRRLANSAAKAWLAYVVRVSAGRAERKLVVADRWIYGYVVQPTALRFYGHRGWRRGTALSSRVRTWS